MEQQVQATADTSAPAESSAPLSVSEVMSTSSGSGGAEEFTFPDRTPSAAEPPSDDAAPTNGGVPAEVTATTEAPDAATSDEFTIPDDVLKEFGSLDPKNPDHRKALAAIAQLRAVGQQTEVESVEQELTELEKSVLAVKPEVATPVATPQAEVKPLEPGKFGDIGDAWTKPEDAIQAIANEYAQDTPDIGKIAQMEHAVFMRRLTGMGVPLVKQLIESHLKQVLGDFPDKLKADSQQSRSDANLRVAEEQLRATKGFEDFDDLFKPQGDAKVKFGNYQYPNTPINAILASNPEILKIQVQHPDEDIAEQLTETARLKMIHRIYRQQKAGKKTLPAARAAEVFQAGKEAATKNPADSTRQSFNSGRGATGSGAGGDADSAWYGSSGSPDSISISDLLRK